MLPATVRTQDGLYRLQKSHAATTGSYCRDSSPGLIMVQGPEPDADAGEWERSVRHEFAIRELIPPHVTSRPLALWRHSGQLLLAREDWTDGLPESMGAPPSSREAFFGAALGAAAAIMQLHQAGLRHAAITPDSFFRDRSGNIRLRGFGHAVTNSRRRESAAPIPSSPRSMDFRYISPEATGRMSGAAPDDRSDLYHLGLVLFEWLCGRPAFEGTDPIELMHAHVAMRPPQVSDLSPDVPQSVSNVIDRLLKKSPSERFQSASSVLMALRACQWQWRQRQHLGASHEDVHSGFLASLQGPLHGRTKELEILDQALASVVQRCGPQLVLVDAPAGMGKTALVQQFVRQHRDGPHRHLLQFAHVKFDQNPLDIPFSALGRGLGDLIRQASRRDEQGLQRFAQKLLEALGANAVLMQELVPELSNVAQAASSAPMLPADESRSRLQLVFAQFIQLFCRDGEPLVVFLDDLQWADEPTLTLIAGLLHRSDSRNLLIIAAAREGDRLGETSAQALSAALSLPGAGDATVRKLSLNGLPRSDLQSLLSQVTAQPEYMCSSIVDDLLEEAHGNPLWTIEILRDCMLGGQLSSHGAEDPWCLTGRPVLRSEPRPANVVSLLSARVMALPASERTLLENLALLGNDVPLDVVRLACASNGPHVEAQMTEALAVGLVRVAGGRVQFLHDGIQAACSSLIEADQRETRHLMLGRALAVCCGEEAHAEIVYRAALHLNQASHRVADSEERLLRFQLNMRAGRLARRNMAYTAAVKFFDAAVDYLEVNFHDAAHHDPRAYEAYFGCAEAKYLAGDFQGAERGLEAIAARQLKEGDGRLSAVALQMSLHASMGHPELSLALATQALASIGVHFPQEQAAGEAGIDDEHRRIAQLHQQHPVQVRDADRAAIGQAAEIIDLLVESLPFAYLTRPWLFRLISLHCARRIMTSGTTPKACVGLASCAVVLVCAHEDPSLAQGFADWALRLDRHHGRSVSTGGLYNALANHLACWTQPFSAIPPLLQEGLSASLELGNLHFVGGITYQAVWHAVERGEALGEVWSLSEQYLQLNADHKDVPVSATIRLQQRFLTQLQGRPMQDSFKQEIDASQCLAHVRTGAYSCGTAYFHVMQAFQRFVLGDTAGARDASDEAERLIEGVMGMPIYATHYFVRGLLMCGHPSFRQSDALQQELAAIERRLSTWSRNSNANYGCRLDLLHAETARSLGRLDDADRLYESALRGARLNGFPYVEAIAHELASKCYAARGLDTAMRAHLSAARAAFVRWGADAKVRQIDSVLPLASGRQAAQGRSTHEALWNLDAALLARVTHAIAGEIEMSPLIEQLLTVSLQFAGADHAMLLLEEQGSFGIEASASIAQGRISLDFDPSPDASSAIPMGWIRDVARTRGALVLNDASLHQEYVSQVVPEKAKARALLCVPLVGRGRLLGVLHLENHLAASIFTAQRVDLLQAVASQAAVSLENARLYADLKRENAERRLTEERLRMSEAFLAEGQQLGKTGSFAWEAATRQFLWSAETYRILGYDPSMVPGESSFMNRVHEDDLAEVEQMLSSAMAGVPELRGIYRVRLPDGAIRYVQVFSRLAELEPGQRRYVGAISDITDARNAQEALLQAQSDLTHAARVSLLGELAAVITHEVMQPLAGTVTNAEAGIRWLDRDTPAIDRAKKSLELVVADARRAGDVVLKLRSMGQKSPGSRERLDIGDLIRETMALMRSELERSSVQLHVTAPGDLHVDGDRVQLQQVLINFVLNAMQSMQQTIDRPRRMQVKAGPGRERFVRVSVSDSGEGIDDAQISRVFDAFFTTKSDGMGIGLSVSRSIILSHGGSVFASNNDDVGATVSFDVPLHELGLASSCVSHMATPRW